MKTYLPITIKYSPIRKLALIPFEKHPDIIYRGFELQFIDGQPYGTGYRVLGYRNDNFVDVYDDVALKFIEDEKFNVAENGLKKHVQTPIRNVQFCKEADDNQVISFEFIDIQNRKISVHLEERSKKKSKTMNILAPIGAGSKKPEYLPVFFLYDFDLMRKSKSIVSCNIDGKNVGIDRFPIPMGGQSRLYARYSNECELFEFAVTYMTELQEIELNEDKIFRDGNVEYLFDDNNCLQKVTVYFGEQDVQIFFDSGLRLDKSCTGNFSIKPREQMGYIQGEYSVECKNDTAIFKLEPKCGWVSKPDSFMTKLILGKKSVFCTWSKKYMYEAKIDLIAKKIEASWKNGNLK